MKAKTKEQTTQEMLTKAVEDSVEYLKELHNAEQQAGEASAEADEERETLNDAVYDVNWVVGRDKEAIGTRIMLAGGGPTIWADTELKTVEGYWGGDSVKRYLPSEVCAWIDESCPFGEQ